MHNAVFRTFLRAAGLCRNVKMPSSRRAAGTSFFVLINSKVVKYFLKSGCHTVFLIYFRILH